MKKTRILPSLESIVIGVLFFCATTVTSQAEDGMNFSLGTGVYTAGVYMGSDETYVAPALLLQGTYSVGNVSLSLDLLEGPGVIYTNPQHNIMFRFGATFDQERNSQTYSVFGQDKDLSNKTRNLLQDTPTVKTDFAPEAATQFMSRAGILGISAAYHPTSVDYSLPGQIDKDLDGWLYAISYANEYTLAEGLLLSVMGELTYMNQDYARAWYSVEYATPKLEKFAAQAGFRDLTLGLQATKKLSERIGVALLLAGTRLLEDAADTPYTVETFQPTAMLYAFYTF